MTRLSAVSDRPTPNRVALRRPTLADVPTVAGVVAAAVGALVLVGWLIDSEVLKAVVPRAVAMKPGLPARLNGALQALIDPGR